MWRQSRPIDAPKRTPSARYARLEEARIKAQKTPRSVPARKKERKEMEDRVRLEEAERRARIEAQARIEENRLAAEAEAIRTKPIPWKLIGAVAAALVTLSVVILIVVNRSQAGFQDGSASAADRQAGCRAQVRQGRAGATAKVLTEKMGEVDRINSKMLGSATDEKERIELARQARDAARRASAAAAEADSQRRAAKEREKKAKFERCKGSDDPLCGINSASRDPAAALWPCQRGERLGRLRSFILLPQRITLLT